MDALKRAALKCKCHSFFSACDTHTQGFLAYVFQNKCFDPQETAHSFSSSGLCVDCQSFLLHCSMYRLNSALLYRQCTAAGSTNCICTVFNKTSSQYLFLRIKPKKTWGRNQNVCSLHVDWCKLAGFYTCVFQFTLAQLCDVFVSLTRHLLLFMMLAKMLMFREIWMAAFQIF